MALVLLPNLQLSKKNFGSRILSSLVRSCLCEGRIMNSFQPPFPFDFQWSPNNEAYRQWSMGHNGYCPIPQVNVLPFNRWPVDYPVMQNYESKPGTSPPRSCLKNLELNPASMKNVRFSVPVLKGGFQGNGLNSPEMAMRGYQNGSPNRSTEVPIHQNSNQRRVCGFCRQNGERREFFLDHALKDCDGKVICPVLQAYVCPICSATGFNAHTLSYCPLNPKKKDPLAIKLKKTTRDSCGRLRYRK